LRSLRGGQASFLYQNGLVDDYFSQFMLGVPTSKGNIGVSFGYYNGGQFELYNGVDNPQPVTAQEDMTATLAYAGKVGSKLSIGVAAKYLRSTLIGRYTATAYAGDLGFQYGLNGRLNVGAAVQNFGSQITYLEEGDDLPQLARGGFSFLMLQGKHPATLMADVVYFTKDQQVQPSAGLEVQFGPLALRGGYKSGSDLKQEFSVGTGFMINRVSLDYSFAMVQNLDSQHRLGVSMRFGQYQTADEFARRTMPTKNRRSVVVEKPKKKEAAEAHSAGATEGRHSLGQKATFTATEGGTRVYVVRPGDTLGKIAERTYGDAKQWTKIYNANRHLMASPTEVEPGQKILLPN
jgi:LysM repeat protein